MVLLTREVSRMISLADYTAQEFIYEGKDTVIYRAKRNRDQVDVVLKTCIEDPPSLHSITQLLHEHQILQELGTDPNIVGIPRVLDLVYSQRKPVIVLEYSRNKSLRLYLAGLPLDLEPFFIIALQLVDILGTLHNKKIIHKDVKTDNIILNVETLSVTLTDFSISSPFSYSSTEENVAAESLSGTLAYISPEQTKRLNRSVDYRTDFYSLGVTFFEMLTASLPFTKKDPIELIYSHLAEAPPLAHTINKKIPKQLALIIAKLMAKAPEERYQCASGLKEDLQKCFAQWQQNKKIDLFPLGQNDFSEQLNISQKLYGREEYINQLVESFKRVTTGGKELMIISGYAGIGKSSLIKEMYLPFTKQNAYVAKGKFDQKQGNIPYSAFTMAFEALIQRLIMTSKDSVEELKETLKKALGINGQILIELIPSLEILLGPISGSIEPNQGAIQSRFLIAFHNLVRVLAKKEHPLVLFIDDWQWSDSASLHLFKALASDESIPYLFIIAAYRDNEVSGPHPFAITLQSLENSNISVNHIMVPPLNQNDIQNLLADTLSQSRERVQPLAQILQEKTQGNPFFINEFLKILSTNNILFYNIKKREWAWDIKQIKKQEYTDNVVDLLISRISGFSSETQKILKVASCIGFSFDIWTLSIVTNLSFRDILSQLKESIECNFIIPLNDLYQGVENFLLDQKQSVSLFRQISFRFSHDKIQQAIHSLISPTEMNKLHLHIGRVFLKNSDYFDYSRYLLEIVNHCNKGIEYVTSADERLQIAELNLKAGLRSNNANAYDSAYDYFFTGVNLLPPHSWDNYFDLTFNLYYEFSQSLFLKGDFEEAEIFFKALIEKAKTDFDRVNVYIAIARLYISQPNYPEAIQTISKALACLGYHFTPNPSKFDVIREYFHLKWLLWGRKVEDLANLPEITDQRWRLILKAMNLINLAAILTDRQVFAMIVFKTLIITYHHGSSPYGANAYLAYAAILLKNKLDIPFEEEEYALKFSDLSLKLIDQYNIKSLKAECYQYYGLAFHYRRHSIRDCGRYFEEGYILSKETGNLAYAAYNLHHLESSLFISGEPIPKLYSMVQNALKGVNISNGREEYACLTIINQFHETLLDGEQNHEWTFETFKERELGVYPLDQKLYKVPTLYHYRRSFYYYIMGEYEEALWHYDCLKEVLEARKHPVITFLWIIYYFYFPLTLTAMYNTLPSSQKKECIEKIKDLLKLLELRNKTNPQNHRNKYLLVRAELSRIMNKPAQALADYLQSIQIARETGLLHEEAIANELLGNYYQELGDLESSKAHILEAYHKFDIWGGVAKLTQLERKHPSYIKDFTNTHKFVEFQSSLSFDSIELSDKAINVASILRAFQAVSSEIELNSLLNKLLTVLLENAGAQKIVLLKYQGDKWFVEAEGTPTNKQLYVTSEKQVGENSDVPLTLIDYVKSTKKPLTINDASQEYKHMNDPYLKKNMIKSVLIIPLIYQGELSNIVYLENNAISGAFTEDHLHTLQLISSQAAISLRNANLYSQATHDPLTDLGNRNLLYTSFQRSSSRASRDKKMLGVLFIDLDFFKSFNDQLGHESGDAILLHVAGVIKNCIRSSDLAVRLGGDEFVILLENIENRQQVMEIAERFYKFLTTPLQLKGVSIVLSASMGISLYPSDGSDINTLLSKADTALYKVKGSGRNRYAFFQDSLESPQSSENV